MTLRDVWVCTPQSFIFVRQADGNVKEYQGDREEGKVEIELMRATRYPMYDSVIEVTLKEGEKA